jgi:glycosyltransferase involved in cell wall biosynthesis
MIIGYGPLPRLGMAYVTGAALRTRQMLKAVVAAGHTVNLFTLPIHGTEGTDGDVPAMVPDSHEGLGFQRFTSHSGEFAIGMLREQARQLAPDAVVGVNTYPAYLAAMMESPAPLWADLPGFWMAENQGLCWIHQDDERLAEAWAIERTIVRRLDKFSAVSRAQLHAVLGELATVGRMNRYTFEYPFGHHAPHACHRWSPAPGDRKTEGAEAAASGAAHALRGPAVPADAFIILWSGSFGVSSDVPMLVSVVNKLMERYRGVHFVATGGRVEGVVDRPYHMLQELIEESPFKDRFHLLGWVASDRLPGIYREADMAIHVDARNYETMFGGRSRLGTLAAEGVPIATTVGTEFSEWLDDGRAVMTAPLGDADAMAQAIEPWIEQREGLKAYAQRASLIAEKDFSCAATTKALIGWLKAPKLAPDNRVKLQRADGETADLASIALNSLEEQAVLLGQHRPETLAAAAAKMDEDRSRKGFLFGFRRG